MELPVGAHDDGDAGLHRDLVGGDEAHDDGGARRRGLHQDGGQDPHHEAGDGVVHAREHASSTSAAQALEGISHEAKADEEDVEEGDDPKDAGDRDLPGQLLLLSRGLGLLLLRLRHALHRTLSGPFARPLPPLREACTAAQSCQAKKTAAARSRSKGQSREDNGGQGS